MHFRPLSPRSVPYGLSVRRDLNLLVQTSREGKAVSPGWGAWEGGRSQGGESTGSWNHRVPLLEAEQLAEEI